MMATSALSSKKSPKPKDKLWAISSIDNAIGVFNVIKDTIEIIPAKGVFGSVAMILGLIRVSCFTASPTLQTPKYLPMKLLGQDD